MDVFEGLAVGGMNDGPARPDETGDGVAVAMLGR